MRAVNLLPRQQVAQKRERTNTVALVAALGGGVVLLVLAAGFLLANRSVDRQRQALATARAVLAVTPAKTMSAETRAYRTRVLSQREQRSLALAAALGKRVSWDRILRRIALVNPGDIWLTKVHGSVPLVPAIPAGSTTGTAPVAPSALPATPTELEIDGKTHGQASVARFLERLQVIPDLKNVQLQTSAPDQGMAGVVDFVIIANVRQGRGTS